MLNQPPTRLNLQEISWEQPLVSLQGPSPAMQCCASAARWWRLIPLLPPAQSSAAFGRNPLAIHVLPFLSSAIQFLMAFLKTAGLSSGISVSMGGRASCRWAILIYSVSWTAVLWAFLGGWGLFLGRGGWSMGMGSWEFRRNAKAECQLLSSFSKILLCSCVVNFGDELVHWGS